MLYVLALSKQGNIDYTKFCDTKFNYYVYNMWKEENYITRYSDEKVQFK